MARSTEAQRSPLGLVVLGLLMEGPTHVYRMQKLIEQYGKDRVVNVRRRGSLYQAIQRLTRLGLVQAAQTVRGDSHPDRILYVITDAGRQTATRWLREMLRTTGEEFPEFLAAVSVLVGLTPDDAREQLDVRADSLAAELGDIQAQLARPDVPRLFLLEEECRRAVVSAELAWVRSVADDLREGRLTWDETWRGEVAAEFAPAHEKDGQ